MLTVYGIKNCNTLKKALDFLNTNNIEYQFHDYKKQGITKNKLDEWSKQLGYEALLNKKGTTWRTLEETVKQNTTNKKAALELMTEKTSVIKRPLIENDYKVVALGFDSEAYKKIFL